MKTYLNGILPLTLCLILISSASFCDSYDAYVCWKNDEKSVEVPLHCSSADEKIHVLHELIASTTVAGSCNTTSRQCALLNTTDRSLAVDCNGRQSCNETVGILGKCDSNNRLVRVTYECITGTGQINMCEEATRTLTDGAVYLQSPGFPDSAAVSGICSCHITGSRLSLQLLETTGLRTGSLVIETDSKQIWPDVLVRPILSQYNRILDERRTTGEKSVKYDNNNNPGEDVWIKISGEGGVTVRCDGGNEDSATTLTSTAVTTSTSSTTSTSTSFETSITTSTPAFTVTSTLTETSRSTSTSSPTPTTIDAHTSTMTQGYNTGGLLTRQEWILVGGCAGGGVVFITVVVVIVICMRRKRDRGHIGKGEVVEMDRKSPSVYYAEIPELSSDLNYSTSSTYLEAVVEHNYDTMSSQEYTETHLYENTGYIPDSR